MKIIGHEKQRELLSKLVQTREVPHAMLFNGDAGIGKKLVALEFARTFYCEDYSKEQVTFKLGGCNECKSCRLFNDFAIPDFYFVECGDKEQVKTENIRELLYNLNLKNFSSKYKFIIFNDAHLIREQSANILLKTLEEPKSDTYFILITSNFSKLPITITSRCHMWHFSTLTNDEILEILKEKNLSLKSKNDIELLEGSLINLELILNNENKTREFEEKINLILKGDIYVLNLFASELAKNKNKDELKYDIHILRNIIRKKMTNETDLKLKSIFAITLEALISCEYLIFDRYLNAESTLCNIFFNLLPTNKLNKSYSLPLLY
ncbi:MAG: hypothetical protein ACOX3T_06995 [Bdellovibrionota bacterium]